MKRHRFDPFSLLFGAIFLSVGVSFVVGSTIAEAWHGVWPMIAVVVGATLAVWAATVAFGERRPRLEDEPTTGEPTGDLTDPGAATSAGPSAS